jgi:hypothetical protein
VTGPVGGIEDFVIEDGKIERQPQPDGVGGLHLGFGNVKCLLVGSFAILGHGCNREKKNRHQYGIRTGTNPHRDFGLKQILPLLATFGNFKAV